MKDRVFARLVMLGVVCSGITGCGKGTPSDGSRAVVAADYLEKQSARIEQIRASMKTQPAAKPGVRR